MNRKVLVRASALLMILGSACPLCDTSCVSEETAPMPDADRRLANLFARSAAAAPTPAMQREWAALRGRWQEALMVHGPSAVVAEARLGGSATLAGSPDARERFRQGMARIDAKARARHLPNAAEMARVQRLLVSHAEAARLRGDGERATPGAGGDRAYLSGAFVGRELQGVFATLADELSAGDVSLTPAIAARLDQKLVSIHPYVDGNGRVARLMADWLLARDGYPPLVPTVTAALHVTHAASENVAPTAHLERITEGMRNAVVLAELGSAMG